MESQIQELTDQMEACHWWFTARRQIIVGLAGRLLPETANVVDIGCGRGHILAGMPGSWNRAGVDPSPRAIELGRSRYPGLDLREGLAPAAVRTELKRADFVLFCDVLEHVEEAEALLAFVVRELHPKCQVLITVPAGMELWSPHDVAHGHVKRYERQDLISLFRDLPVRLRLLSPLNWRLYPLLRIVRIITRWKDTASGSAGTDLFLPPRLINSFFFHIFRGEMAAILRSLDAPERTPPWRGASWIAVMERDG